MNFISFTAVMGLGWDVTHLLRWCTNNWNDDILTDRTLLAKFDPAALAIAQPGFIADNMIQLYSDDRYTLYRLRE